MKNKLDKIQKIIKSHKDSIYKAKHEFLLEYLKVIGFIFTAYHVNYFNDGDVATPYIAFDPHYPTEDMDERLENVTISELPEELRPLFKSTPETEYMYEGVSLLSPEKYESSLEIGFVHTLIDALKCFASQNNLDDQYFFVYLSSDNSTILHRSYGEIP